MHRGHVWEVTEKLDGTSATFSLVDLPKNLVYALGMSGLNAFMIIVS